jgi:hypothetical protein
MLTPQRRTGSQPNAEPVPVPLESLHVRSATVVSNEPKPSLASRRSAPTLSTRISTLEKGTPAKGRGGGGRAGSKAMSLRGWQDRSFQTPSYVYVDHRTVLEGVTNGWTCCRLTGALVVPCVVDQSAIGGRSA